VDNAQNNLHSIEDVEEFYERLNRSQLTKKISEDRPYVYWTMEVYDKSNGIKGGGGLGVLAADTRRVAEQLQVPFVLITPFYPWESHQTMDSLQQKEYHVELNYQDFGFHPLGEVKIKTNTTEISLTVIEKVLGTTRFLCMTEPNFGELYSGDGSGDHRLYQEVALGFGGYEALRLADLKPAIIQLNEVATFFAALARLDELVSNGMDFYEAIVYVRKHTLYTNHTLVQAAESEFTYDQFSAFVFPNIKSPAIRRWLSDKFKNGRLRLSSVTIEIAELRSGVSKIHARVANYRDINGDKVKFKAITNGIDISTWVAPSIIKYFRDQGIIDKFNLPVDDYEAKIRNISAADIRHLKAIGRARMNEILVGRKDQYGNPVEIPTGALVFEFKRRFADYKRPWLPFTNPAELKNILETHNAHYLFAGKVHMGDATMYGKLLELLSLIDNDPVLKQRVHYLSDYDETLGLALSLGSNISINVPIVGLEACGTSWMKDIANLGVLISTPDGGVADCPPTNYLEVSGATESAEIETLYHAMHKAAEIWANDAALTQTLQTELTAYLPVISGARMLKDYLNYLF
jgi:starch phosphorylase